MTQRTHQIDPHHARQVAERLLRLLGPAPTIFDVLSTRRRMRRVPVQTEQGRLAG